MLNYNIKYSLKIAQQNVEALVVGCTVGNDDILDEDGKFVDDVFD